ncbi:hypothetical protein [Solidesulfovibrio sp.]|uniref:hypothetical protein n=1 Tax=Solidesulfovibrio sp. TaxID=2910990 RepID=UPI002B2034A9|nr:hypothetical protein [Solidesulfovibrio sp.]MEA4858362.1 hypothetical protein [Solidesulfovibrio sp.]
MEKRDFPWGRLAAAGITVLLLNLAGVVWLNLTQERLRTELAALDRDVRAIPPAAPCGDTEALESEIAALRQAVTGLAAKTESPRPQKDDAKALDRLAGEVKNLAAKVEALAAAKAPPAKPAGNGKSDKSAPRPQAPAVPGNPYYGPGYPGWPGY